MLTRFISRLLDFVLKRKTVATQEALVLGTELKVVKNANYQMLVDKNEALYSPLFLPHKDLHIDIWNALLLTPLFFPDAWQVKNVLILGLGAGYIANGLVHYYPGVQIDGVELEPAIVELGQKYFNLVSPAIKIHIADAREFVAKKPASGETKYDLIICDLYVGKKPPKFVLGKDFLEDLWKRLNEPGLVAFNFNRRPEPDKDATLFQLSQSLFCLTVPGSRLIVALNQKADLSALKQRFAEVGQSQFRHLSGHFASKLKKLK